jgi:hypothetical protein
LGAGVLFFFGPIQQLPLLATKQEKAISDSMDLILVNTNAIQVKTFCWFLQKCW